jgi:hypothetical protein
MGEYYRKYLPASLFNTAFTYDATNNTYGLQPDAQKSGKIE